MLRGTLVLALLTACISLSAVANDVTIVNANGTLSSNAGRSILTLNGSSLTGISGLAGVGVPDQSATFSSCQATGCLGNVTLMTGTKTSGFLTTSFVAPVPEPDTLLLMGTGLVGLASLVRRRRRLRRSAAV